MECTRKLKFGMMIYHDLVNSFGYSMMPYDLDCNLKVVGIGYNPYRAFLG